MRHVPGAGACDTPHAGGSLAAEAADLLTRDVRTAPTLVKYAEPNQYLMETRAALEQAATELLSGVPIAAAPLVDLVERTESLEVELAATLMYWASDHPYRQVRDIVAGLPEARVEELIELGLRKRGRHDEALRAFHAGAALRFDVLMDIGGFRDMHRHRRATQIKQGFTAQLGYETPVAGDLGGGCEPAGGGGNAGRLPGHGGSGACRQRADCAGAAPEAALSRFVFAAAGHACPLPVQDGFRRGAVYFGAAFGAGGTFQLPARGVGDVPGVAAPAPGVGEAHPRH